MVYTITSLLPMILSLLLLTLLIAADGVHTFGEKTVLPLHQLQWKQQIGIRTCFSQQSRTVITRLVPSFYRAVKAEFLKQSSGFPTAPGFSILDTCFNLSGYDEVDVPTMKMNFEGDAEMDVDVNGIFYFVKTDASQVCLALASLSYEYEIGIIGNYQQRNVRVVYDTKGSKLGFAKEMCSSM